MESLGCKVPVAWNGMFLKKFKYKEGEKKIYENKFRFK